VLFGYRHYKLVFISIGFCFLHCTEIVRYSSLSCHRLSRTVRSVAWKQFLSN